MGFEGINKSGFGLVTGLLGDAAHGMVAVAQHLRRRRHFQGTDEGLYAAARCLLEFARKGGARHAGDFRQPFSRVGRERVGEDAGEGAGKAGVGKERGQAVLFRQFADVAQREQQQDFAERADDGEAALAPRQRFVMNEGAKCGQLWNVAKRDK